MLNVCAQYIYVNSRYHSFLKIDTKLLKVDESETERIIPYVIADSKQQFKVEFQFVLWFRRVKYKSFHTKQLDGRGIYICIAWWSQQQASSYTTLVLVVSEVLPVNNVVVNMAVLELVSSYWGTIKAFLQLQDYLI